MEVLLHTCCAPCSVKCIDVLEEESFKPVIFWYNPNIHPYTEYKSRRNTLKEYAKKRELEAIIKDDYGLREFINLVYPDFENRCEKCYKIRLEETAKYAAENDYKYFSTTLLISPYQKHDLIISVAEGISKKYGVEFLYRDFRPHFREGQKIARDSGMYMQKYCGCIFSEEDRYLKANKR